MGSLSQADTLRDGVRHRTVVVADDGGGLVRDYDRRFNYYKATYTPVVIKGECDSACARYMLLPNVCAAKGAVFGFHAMFGKDEADILPDESRADSIRTDNAAALALETKYDSFHMGTTYTRPYASRTVEPGVRIRYDAFDFHGKTAYQEMLFVDANKLIPVCKG